MTSLAPKLTDEMVARRPYVCGKCRMTFEVGCPPSFDPKTGAHRCPDCGMNFHCNDSSGPKYDGRRVRPWIEKRP